VRGFPDPASPTTVLTEPKRALKSHGEGAVLHRSAEPCALRLRAVNRTGEHKYHDAVVHEWVAERAGSEKVFERIASVLPEAELIAMTFEPTVRIETGGRPIRTTFLDNPFFRDHRAASLPLMPAAWRWARRGREYDLVITSAHAFAREFVSRSRVRRHLCYVHAPMRYAWERATDPRTQSKLAVAPAAVLRWLDKRSVPGVDSFAVNSSETQSRLRRHYGRDAQVIHPPVDTAFFRQAVRDPQGYLLAFGRFIDYKRFDLAIGVAEAVGRPLVVAGSGPLEASIRAMGQRAVVPVTVVVKPPDDELLGLFGGAEALLFPGIEDFGIIPVEAQAAGVPVIGPALGGLRDTVDHGVTGVLVEDQTVEALAAGVLQALAAGLGGEPCRAWAEQFRPERFDRDILDWIAAST
jgi:glycosyltransferase involved in cell wall biosynthesis